MYVIIYLDKSSLLEGTGCFPKSEHETIDTRISKRSESLDKLGS